MKLRPLGLVMCHFERSREAKPDVIATCTYTRVLDYARTDMRDARTDKGDARTESDARTDKNSQIKNQIIFEIIK
jgi:hypothetical protein